jgi:hypothetical protein
MLPSWGKLWKALEVLMKDDGVLLGEEEATS